MNDSYHTLGPIARENLRRATPVLGPMNRQVLWWGRINHWLLYRPGRLSTVQCTGLEHLPALAEPAPILAFTHKTGLDVQAIIEFLVGRPADRLHGACMVAQAGLYNNVFAYAEALPRFFRSGPGRALGPWLARRIGAVLRYVFSTASAYPLYRPEDQPVDASEYETRFGGRAVTGLDYDRFRAQAGRVSRQSLHNVFRDMSERNRSFVILPEGGYLHDGTVRPLQEFVAMASFRKQRAVVPVCLAYDELCPDRRGRVPLSMRVLPAVPAPKAKGDMPDFLEGLRQQMQAGTPVTASAVIAWALDRRRNQRSFKWTEFTDECDGLRSRVAVVKTGDGLQEPAPSLAPGARSTDELAQQLTRFRAAHTGRWFRIDADNRVTLDAGALDRFDPEERTVDDVAWNRNHVGHLQAILSPG